MNITKFLIATTVVVALLSTNFVYAQSGTGISSVDTELCAEWNSYLGMLNVNEYANAVPANRNIEISLFDSLGMEQSVTGTEVLASAQRDILVHELSGFEQNSYGRTCTEVTNGDNNDIAGRAIHYYPSGAGFDFAISLPFSNGKLGSQFVPFNTYDPSLNSANFVANWVSVTNNSSTTQSGTLFYYNSSGNVLDSEQVTIPAGGRTDFAAHQFGASLVGLVEWRPDSVHSRFIVRNVRYYYDNPEASASFNSALQIEAMPGTGEETVVFLDKRNGSAVLELSNVTNATISVTATFRSLSGLVVDTQNFQLGAFASLHVVADEILPSALGSVTLNPSAANSIIAAGLHYTRDGALQLRSAYALPGQIAQGSVLNGTYNTYLGQSCDLILVNTTNTLVMSTITMTRNDGFEAADGLIISTPAAGISNYDLCVNDSPDNYGAVRVVPESANALTGAVVRHGANNGANNRYQIATELRQPAGPAQLSISGSPLLLETNGPTGALTVTNTSLAVTAQNISSNFTGTALDGQVAETGNTCATLAPQASCMLTYTPGDTVVGQTTFTIAGTGTETATASIEIASAVTLDTVTPTSGSASGGTAVTLTGTNLTGATAVSFGGVAATSVNVVNSTTITAVTPANAATTEVVDVVVTTPSGSATLANGYTYVTTAIGQSAHGGTIACLNAGLNNLIAASADNNAGVIWGSHSVTNAQSATDGAANTATIVAALGANGGTPYAAQVCDNYQVDSQGNTPCQVGNTCYNDWFLPAGSNSTATGQLNCLYTNRAELGEFSGNFYWSSTEFSGAPEIGAGAQSFLGGQEDLFDKMSFFSVRCVRAFNP